MTNDKTTLKLVTKDIADSIVESLKQSDDGSGGGGSMDGRIATLESDVRHIRTDMSEMKIDIREIRDELKETRLDIHRESNKIMIFTTTIVIASMAIMAAIFAYIVA